MRAAALATVALSLVAVACAELDPQVQAWLTASDVAVPNNDSPASQSINVAGDGCLSPKEVAYSSLILEPGQDAPGPAETCLTALLFKDYEKQHNSFGTWPGPRWCPANLDGIPWSYFTDTVAKYRAQCQESPVEFIYSFT